MSVMLDFKVPSLSMVFWQKPRFYRSTAIYIKVPSARYHGLRMRQNLVQWIPQIERHMACVDQSEASKE